jgi:hypothetical protein
MRYLFKSRWASRVFISLALKSGSGVGVVIVGYSIGLVNFSTWFLVGALFDALLHR